MGQLREAAAEELRTAGDENAQAETAGGGPQARPGWGALGRRNTGLSGTQRTGVLQCRQGDSSFLRSPTEKEKDPAGLGAQTDSVLVGLCTPLRSSPSPRPTRNSAEETKHLQESESFWGAAASRQIRRRRLGEKGEKEMEGTVMGRDDTPG